MSKVSRSGKLTILWRHYKYKYKYPLYLLQSFWNIFQRKLCNVVAWQFPMLISSLLCFILSSVSIGENCNCNFPIVKLLCVKELISQLKFALLLWLWCHSKLFSCGRACMHDCKTKMNIFPSVALPYQLVLFSFLQKHTIQKSANILWLVLLDSMVKEFTFFTGPEIVAV